jgi:CheY-like chemotaxis protein
MCRPALVPDRRRRILVIDDDAMLRALLRDLLEDEGYQVSTQPALAPEGMALAALAPDLIVLDARGGGGRELRSTLQRLRQDPQTAGIPLVLCTGAVREVDAWQPRLDAWGVAVVLKPFDIDHFAATIAAQLVTPAVVAAADD